MEHGVRDAQQRAVSSRQERSRLQERLQSARLESGTLREYSRRRFQSVVELETKPHPPPPLPPPPPLSPFHNSSQQQRQQQQQQAQRAYPTSRPKTTDGSGHQVSCTNPVTPTTPTNGPTRDGSILYNGVPLLLSSIRTRPKSEPPSRFDHLRGTYANYPYIQRTLEQSNCDYRLEHSPCPTAREEQREPPASPDFVMLIPVTSHTPDVTQDDEDSRGMSLDLRQNQAWAEEPPLLVSTARSRSPRSEGSAKAEEMIVQEGEHLDSDRGYTPTERGCSSFGLPRLDLSESRQQPETKPSLTPRLLPRPSDHAPPNSGRRSSRDRKKRPESRRTSAMSDTSSVISDVSFTPRPHCWVDDVTVSSDESLTERDLSLQRDLDDRVSVHSEDLATKGHPQGLAPGQLHRVNSPSGDKKKLMQMSKRAASPVVKRVPSAGKGKPGPVPGAGAGPGGGCPRSLKQSSGSGSKAGGGTKSPVLEQELSIVKENEEEEVILPRFVCPSSETKSRQEAIKEWLAKTSFSTACRTLPLM